MEHKHTPGSWAVEPPSDSEPEYDKHEKDYRSIRALGPNDCISHEVARLSGWWTVVTTSDDYYVWKLSPDLQRPLNPPAPA